MNGRVHILSISGGHDNYDNLLLLTLYLVSEIDVLSSEDHLLRHLFKPCDSEGLESSNLLALKK